MNYFSKILSSNKFFFISISLISFFVLLIFVKSPGINGYERAMVPEMVYGKAWKPFVYRTLLPTTVCAVAVITPSEIKSEFQEISESENFIGRVFSKLKWETEFAYEYFLVNILMYLSLIGFAFTFRLLMKNVFVTSQSVFNVVTLLSVLSLPPLFSYYNYIYDFPTLFLFTLGLVFLYKQKWNLYFLIFILACINKETTILLTLIFAVYYFKNERLERKTFHRLILIQIIIFIVIKLILTFIFQNNPGGMVEFHLGDHNWKIINGYGLVDYSLLIAVFILIFYKWKDKPEFLKVNLWILIPLLILTTFFGFLDELRDYYEVYPAVFMLISFSATRILNISIEAKPVGNR